MTIALNGTTGIITPDIDSVAAPDLVGTNFTSLPSGQLVGALPAISGSSLTSLPAANLTGALPAIDGSALTGINSGSTTVVRSTAFSGGTSYRYSYAHGQGSVPDLVWLELKILVAEHGYAVGASIKINNMLELDETDYVMSLSGTSTTLNYAGNQSSLYRYVARNDIDSTADVVFTTSSFETYLVGVWF